LILFSNNKIPLIIKYQISSNNRIPDLAADITDMSSNKAFIRQLQTVNYAFLNPPPNPPIQSGYNGAFCTDYGVNIVTQNVLPTNISTPSVLEF
jgi:hypothetical protein